MSQMGFTVKRTGWDIVLGALLLLAGLVILVHAAIATKVSIVFVGWVLLIIGVAGLVGCLFRIGRGGFWSLALSGALLAVLGLFFLRNTDAAAVTLTLLAGLGFLTSGIARLAVSGVDTEYRMPLIIGGAASTVLGLLVLFNLFTASYVLVGVLLGIQVMIDGIELMLIGRWHTAGSAAMTPHPA